MLQEGKNLYHQNPKDAFVALGNYGFFKFYFLLIYLLILSVSPRVEGSKLELSEGRDHPSYYQPSFDFSDSVKYLPPEFSEKGSFDNEIEALLNPQIYEACLTGSSEFNYISVDWSIREVNEELLNAKQFDLNTYSEYKITSKSLVKDNFDAVKFLNVFNKAHELGYFSSISAELFIQFILQDFRDETIVFNKLNGKDSQFFFPFLILLEECELLCIKTLSKINSNGFLKTSGGGIKRTNDMATKVRDCVKKYNLASSASFKLLADFIIDEFELQNSFSSESVLDKLIRFT